MRFVPTSCLREGMVLGNNLLGKNGELVLAHDVTLTTDFIHRIKQLNYNGIYVEDAISRDLEIASIIDDRVKAKTVSCIKDVFICAEKTNTITKQKFTEMQNQIETIIDEILNNKSTMINMIDLKVFDDYTYFHSVNVAVLSIVLGVSMGLKKQALSDLGIGAILHDIGKIFISKQILCKNGMLTDDEFGAIKKHSQYGYDYIKKEFNMSHSARLGILDHHEKYEGGGYPNSSIGDEISLFGRIISIADVYDAMTSDRSYRKAIIPSEVIEYIMGNSETIFDPELVDIFIKKIAPYPTGTCVELSNGLTGIVIENYENYCMRPKIRIYKDKKKDIEMYDINLADKDFLNVTITKVVDLSLT
ncbi:HD domain-containing protein [Acetobacterium fimetarium]|uniref:HD domain-containing protein n=2 Tax=Acetobacterium fimetarium TaxID=52691 RepID=A0ABR6WW03_9FIRM|nr:HD domain-containing protein [Acetobacterium fimetarium]